MARISETARTVMAALEAGRAFVAMGDAWRAGSLIATAATMAELKRHDLVREADGQLLPSAAGRGFTQRSARPEDGNRLLGERALSPDGRGRRVTVNHGESPLSWLRARGMVDGRQYEAAERLRGDWETAMLAPRVTMRWEATPSSHTARSAPEAIDPTLAQIAAKRRFDAATTALGAGLGDVAWRVICAGEGLETAERAMGWPKRAGKLVLLMALDRLADHYGIK